VGSRGQSHMNLSRITWSCMTWLLPIRLSKLISWM
jgi:hypothetical protein